MRKLKIGVFAYNWPHYKTQQGLINMCIKGYKPDIVFCADPVELNFYKSKVRITPKDMYLHDTRDICKYFDIPFEVIVHNSEYCENLIKNHCLDLGVILGARILKKNIIDSFNVGILNAHPGLLPANRGLDTIKWALVKKIKQGVTCHLIDHKIDIGRLVALEEIKVYKDDSLIDLYLRIQSLEQNLIIKSLKSLNEDSNIHNYVKLTSGENYHKSLPPDIEANLNDYLLKYLKEYGE